MFLPVPPGGAETLRTVTAAEVPVEIAIPAPRFVPVVPVVAAAIAIAATEVVTLPEVVTAAVEPT
jgi:hypothetical protein